MRHSFRSRRGHVAAALLILLVVMLGLYQTTMIIHRSVDGYLDASDFAKQRRLDAESLENLTVAAVYRLRESTPAGYGKSEQLADVMDELVLAAGAFGADGGSVVDYRVTRDLSYSSLCYPDTANYMARFDSGSFRLPRHMESLLAQGPVASMGAASVEYEITYPGAGAGSTWTYRVATPSFYVPITNWPVVIYGLPMSGAVQDEIGDYAWLGALRTPTFDQSGGTVLLTSVLNPETEAVTNPSYDAVNQALPRMYVPYSKLTWSLYELINSEGWKDRFQIALNALNVSMNSSERSNAPGVKTGQINVLIVDLSEVEASVINIDVAISGAQIVVTGTADDTLEPVTLMVRNRYGLPGRIRLMGDNQRATLIYNDSLDVDFADGISWRGGLILNANRRLCTVSGRATLYGHLSIDSWGERAVSYASNWELSVLPDQSVVNELAGIAPCALLVGATSDY